MADLVKMKATTAFHNSLIVIDGIVGGTVTEGSPFEAPPNLAKDLARLGHADLVEGTIHDIPDAPLEPHHSISEPQLRADRERRSAEAASAEGDANAGEASGRRGRSSRAVGE